MPCTKSKHHIYLYNDYYGDDVYDKDKYNIGIFASLFLFFIRFVLNSNTLNLIYFLPW